ncbi:MAG TPA: hypothetical protein VMM59_03790, partial [Thermohalobaculum sp.]|nr:hypothetical protein [Thermohalobaculum sp.]
MAVRLADAARRLALRGLLAGVTALAAAPGPAGAQDCRVGDIGDPTVSARLDERVEDQLRCLQSRLDALKQENDALRDRLEVLEDARAAPAAAYHNRDGTVDRKDRYLGPATFVLTGDRRGRPRSLALDQALVLAMCGDADGCLVSLGLKGIVV